MALTTENFRAWLEDELLRERWWPGLEGEWLGKDTPVRLYEPAHLPAENTEWVVVALPGEPEPSALERPRTLWVDLAEKRIQGKVVDAPAALLDPVRRALSEADVHAQPAPGQAARVQRERGTAVLERRMRRGWGGPAVVALLLLCLVPSVFALTRGTDPGTLYCLGASFAPSVKAGQVWRLLSSVFLHGSALHLVLNMVALAWLGVILERYLGGLRLAVLFVIAGLGGALASGASNEIMVCLGASGAIYGLVAAFLCLSWRGRGLPRRHQPPSPGCLIALLVLDLAGSFSGAMFDGMHVDLAAHAGGFVTGLLASLVLVRPTSSPTGLTRSVLVLLACLPLPALALAGWNYTKLPGLFDYPQKRFNAPHFSIAFPGVLYPVVREGVSMEAGPGFSVTLYSGAMSEEEAAWQWPTDREKLVKAWATSKFKVEGQELLESGGRTWLLLDLAFPDDDSVEGQCALTLEGDALYQVVIYTQTGQRQWGKSLLERSLPTARPVLWSASYYVGKAGSAYRAGRLNQARRHLEYALLADPDDFKAHNLLHRVYFKLQMFKPALAEADRAVTLAKGKDKARALNERAWSLTLRGRHSEALVDAQKALDLLADHQPGWANTIDTRGTALLGLKRYQEALADFDAALTVKPQPAATYHRGQALEGLGRKDEARASYQQSLKLDGKSDYAEGARQGLQRVTP